MYKATARFYYQGAIFDKGQVVPDDVAKKMKLYVKKENRGRKAVKKADNKAMENVKNK